MSTSTRSTGEAEVSVRAGNLALAAGILALAAAALAYVLSLTGVVDPPNWARVVGLAWLPIGLLGAPIAYTAARTGPGRHRGRLGLAVALVALVAFVALQFAAG